jgi:membrane protease YdiL (CAAX protease family)
VQHRPLTWFFGLAMAISWLAWLPYIASTSGLGLINLQIPELLGTTQFIGMLPGAYLGPVTAALIVTATVEGRAGLRKWGHRLVNWKVGWRWYLGVLVGVPTVLLATSLAYPGALSGAHGVGAVVLVGYLPLLVVQFLTTALAEEPGWRDFALPRLQHRHGPVVGTTILGLLWGAWHLPLFLTEWGGWPGVSWVQPVLFVATCVPLSMVMTWVFNRTGGSVPLIMLLHASINTMFSGAWPAVFPGLDWKHAPVHILLMATVVVAAVLLVATRGRLGLPQTLRERTPDSPAQQPNSR